MYIFFLTLRYLTRKAIVLFPILVVWLCVAMMIIVASIMGGFVDHVKQSNHDLMGDIVISSSSGYGFPYYAQLQQELAALPGPDGQPLLEASTPVIQAYGLINIPGHDFNTYVQVVGIDPVGRAAITAFRQTLYRQFNLPIQAAQILAKTGLPATGKQLFDRAQAQESKADDAVTDADVALAKAKSAGASGSRVERLEDAQDQSRIDYYLAQRIELLADSLDPSHAYTSAAEIQDRLLPAVPNFSVPPGIAPGPGNDPLTGCIPAAGIHIYKRDRAGDFIRPVMVDWLPCELTVVPMSKAGKTVEPQSGSFIIVDDSYSQVIDVDSTYVYAPFNRIQQMAFMDAGDDGAGHTLPARCSEIQIKVRGTGDAPSLALARSRIDDAVEKFTRDPRYLQLAGRDLKVETWDQKQALYIGAVQNEKTLITFILGLMSVVVVIVIFLIFYMIVREKTRDIGIIKALGGSESGVMAIFMCYGAFIGVVGGLLGMVTGVLFVWNTNFIHDKIIYGIFGLMIWRRDIYLFDKIPDTVHPWEVAAYVAAAIVAGFLGATIPAIIAALQDPVKAVRYE